MTRRAPGPQLVHERVFYARVRDDQAVTDITLDARAVYHDDDLVDWYLHAGIGPGMGPHHVRDIATIRAVAWAWHHAADALETAGAPRRLLLPAGHVPGQLTIEDALVWSGSEDHHDDVPGAGRVDPHRRGLGLGDAVAVVLLEPHLDVVIDAELVEPAAQLTDRQNTPVVTHGGGAYPEVP
mgnify:CR=1 FL=1